MSPRPVIFISAVSRELHSARDLVAKTLIGLGYEPKWQDIAPTETGDLRGVLRKWVDDSEAVIQLVGHCYGFGPPEADPAFGPCSYTQYEALYARQRGKPVWYILLDAAHPTDGCGCQPVTLHAAQETYRQRVKGYGEVYHPSASLLQTEATVLKLRDDLAHLRRRGKQYAALVLVLLLVVIVVIAWVKRDQWQQRRENQRTAQTVTNTEKTVTRTDEKVDVLLQAVRDLPQTIAQQAQGGQKEDEATRMARAYAALEEKLKLPKGTLEKELPRFAEQLLLRADTSTMDRANALFATRKFAEAEAQALKAMDKALAAAGQPVHDAIEALALAGQSAEAQIHYPQALEHYRAAAALTSQERDPLEWARVQHMAAHVLDRLGRATESEIILRDVVKVRERVLGPDNPATLDSRDNLASALNNQRKYVEAEKEYRVVLAIRERVQGPENRDSLASWDGLANVLRWAGKLAEAEKEHRAVLAIRERVLGAEDRDTYGSRWDLAAALQDQEKNTEAETIYRHIIPFFERDSGAEHPDTLSIRNNLANALRAQGKYAEAEQQHRAVLAIRERVLGAEHPDILQSRNNLAAALRAQGKYAEAEQQHRAVLAIREHVLGAEHPDVFPSCYNLALCLEAQKKLKEALEFMQRAETGWTKTLGADHPYAKDAKAAREYIEAEWKKQR